MLSRARDLRSTNACGIHLLYGVTISKEAQDDILHIVGDITTCAQKCAEQQCKLSVSGRKDQKKSGKPVPDEACDARGAKRIPAQYVASRIAAPTLHEKVLRAHDLEDGRFVASVGARPRLKRLSHLWGI
eukprot:6181674-Pleurochrysis_carterae.AAC.1